MPDIDKRAPGGPRKKILFTAMAVLNIIMNLDGGAVPAAVDTIVDYFALQPYHVGLLGSLVYIGIAMGSLCVAPVLRKFSGTRCTQVAIFLNMLATACFGLAINSGMLLVFRFLIGFLQALPMVYFPVWVDEFAPKQSQALWMAVIQAGAPLGITFGYVLSGLLTAGADVEEGDPDDPTFNSPWRIPFLGQSAVLACFSVASVRPTPRASAPRARDAARRRLASPRARSPQLFIPREMFDVSSVSGAQPHRKPQPVRPRLAGR